jgi:hypothetical protein
MTKFMKEERAIENMGLVRQKDLAAFTSFLETEVYKHYGKGKKDKFRSIAELRIIALSKPDNLRGLESGTLNRHLTFIGRPWRDCKRLFDRLNAAVKKVVAAYPNRAYYVELAGTLAKKFGDADKYKLLWANELHPNEQGFDLLAAQVAKQLKDLKIG